ncbi:hypothetical protein H6G17_07170 [Chroococcidiopsis sp. FACHB-1243]|uniref:hypothetical protein n=1 Tax=Chroococcidiopsis sp. [FACHB-1243] TaxID=2692781 RepID=UPI001785D150|nr:hypothetical protein [Chroococcidiopsis sp. [FACHB-1243]]MBD2305292.1 hypothetical protein [Chroococcidiopsis sp. [FACHB-1243]]
MQKITFKGNRISLYPILWIIGLLYCFAIFIPIPNSLGTDLELSWQYAISRAAIDKLIFGKDIIFTYGPLGYLVHGAALEQNFITVTKFRFIVYLILFVAVSLKIAKLKTKLQKLAIFSSWLLLVSINISVTYQNISTDYQILFIFLIILSIVDNLPIKLTRWCAVSLGAFAGFCLLTKFTLGIATAGSLCLFFFGSFFSAIKKNSNYLVSFFALLDSLLAAISVSFILLSPDFYISNLHKILVCLVLSGTGGVLAWFIQLRLARKVIDKAGEKTIASRDLSSRFHSRAVSWYVFYVIYCLCLVVTIFSSHPSLVDYLKNSLDVASNYSSAMSLVGSRRELILAVSELALISLLLVLVARAGNLGFALALFLCLFLAFKHGFVRHSVNHIVIFSWCTLIVVSLSIPKLRVVRLQKFSYLLYFCVLIIALIFWIPIGVSSPRSITPDKAIANLSHIFNLSSLQASVQANSNNNLAAEKLPASMTSIVEDKKIDIVPWEISLVAANNLNWKPRPIFQSYSAYTTALDNINFKSLSAEPRDYIFYDFSAIDGRHPFFDEPRTFAYIFCNYKLNSYLPKSVEPNKFSYPTNLLLLEKLLSSGCSSSVSTSKMSTVRWNNSQHVEASDRSIILAKVKFTYSLFGKIYKSLFRSPPVTMQVTYADGSKRDYRIIPENSENGVIVSHLPKDDNEALSFFRRQLPAPVQSFRFHATNSLLYSSTIEINFLSLQI